MAEMKVVQLSGGVGGARLARGFAALDHVDLSVVVNVGDDTEVHGLAVSPDVDAVCYALAGIEGPQGWGRAKESFNFNEELATYGIDNTFRLGDRDLALKLARTVALSRGETLSDFTAHVTRALGINSPVLPATDDRLRTVVRLPDGWTSFMDYFVARRHRDPVESLRFEGAESARPAPGVLEAINNADIVVIGPSNPILSIWPILAIADIKEALVAHGGLVAVSPLIAGKAIKGPAREVLLSSGLSPDTRGIAASYEGLVDRLYVDPKDTIAISGVSVVPSNIMIDTLDSAIRLAREIASE